MKKTLFTFILLQVAFLVQAQVQEGTVVAEHISAPSLSLADESTETRTQRVTIYLPPGYHETDRRYPVIYYLHGFTWSDSLQIADDHFDELLDKAISHGVLRPTIVVMPNHHTEYRGSFYTNSSLTGNWADFTAIDVVEYVDNTYRSIPHRESRGIVGHSMGGHGALKIAMMFPSVFASVYALSPAVLGLSKDLGPQSDAYRRAQEIDTLEALLNDFMANAVIAIGRAFSPNPDKSPFQADLPFSFDAGAWTVDNDILSLWHEDLPLEMADEYADSLRTLNAIKLDWGRNDQFDHIPVTASMFSYKLEGLGIDHYAEEYLGDHGNKLWTDDGRAIGDMLPFFDRHLQYDDQ